MKGERLLVPLALLAAVLAVTGFVHLYDPYTYGLYPVCLLKRLTGWQCAGCGATRALYHLTRGEGAEAFRLNPAFVLALPALAAIALARRRWFATPLFWFGLVAALALFTVMRNL